MDIEQARTIVASADPNVLRIALIQATGDEILEAMDLVDGPSPISTKRLTASDAEIVRDRAAAFLVNDLETFCETTPTTDRTRHLMELYQGETLTETQFASRKDDLRFEEVPRSVSWTADRPASADEYSVAIIGGGFSGVSSAIALGRLGISYTLFERRHELGGTWSINKYPDARVDTSIFSYQFGFVKKHPWSEYFARSVEVREYLEGIARDHGVLQNSRLGANVRSAAFDEASSTWLLDVATNGAVEQHRFSAVISAAGLFSTPKIPDFHGLASFQGEVKHTTEWTGDEDVAGKRVAVVGNGSTGVQLLSKISEVAGAVRAFQRTPQWIAPKERYGQPVSVEEQWLLDHMPYYWNWFCYELILGSIITQFAQESDPEWKRSGGQVSPMNDGLRDLLTNYIHKQLEGRPDLIKKVMPDYAPLARRLVVDNDWYATLLRPNVELVTSGIQEFTPEGIRTEDGAIHELDLVLLATGFSVTKYLYPTEYRGTAGVALEEQWRRGDGPRAYLGIAMPKFPNLFVHYGPNSQPRGGAFVSIMEAWAAYSAQLIVHMIEGGYRRVEIREDAFTDYNDEMDKATEPLIWDSEAPAGRNYYVNEHGRQQVNVPWSTDEQFNRLSEPDFRAFTFE